MVYPVKRKISGGFTLLELSIVLVIISTVLGGVMVLFNQSMERQQENETQLKIAAIQKALLDFRVAFNYIPCPADVTQNMDATSNNYYGVEAANPGFCTGGTPAANFAAASGSFTGNTTNASAIVQGVNSVSGLSVGLLLTGTGIADGTAIASIDSATQLTLTQAATATNSGITMSYNSVVGGMVPTKSLKLPDDYAIDGWGRRIMYMVDVNMTVDGGFSNVPVNDAATSRIIVNDTNGIPKTTSAAYLLLSYGKNGHGAYSRAGGSSRLANYISADADELTNCHCNSGAVDAGFSTVFVQKPPLVGAFDDIIAYETRASLRSPNE